MSTAIECREVEPREITSGFSASWRRRLRDLPNAIHTLTYIFRRYDGTGKAVEVTATPVDQTGYQVDLTPADSAKLTEGQYRLVGYVTDDATGGDVLKQVIFDGAVKVLPDPAKSGVESAGFNRMMVDLLRKAMIDLSRGTLSSTSVNGKSYTRRNLAEVRMELARFESLLDAEENEQRIKEGCRSQNNIYVRFHRP